MSVTIYRKSIDVFFSETDSKDKGSNHEVSAIISLYLFSPCNSPVSLVNYQLCQCIPLVLTRLIIKPPVREKQNTLCTPMFNLNKGGRQKNLKLEHKHRLSPSNQFSGTFRQQFQIWVKCGSDWPQIEQINPDIFYEHVLRPNLKKIPDLSYSVAQNHFGPKSDTSASSLTIMNIYVKEQFLSCTLNV